MVVHHPVMLKEVIGFLNLKPGDIVLDATVGGGGHASEILREILPGGNLIGLDADIEAIKIAEESLKDFKGSFKLINDNFRNVDAILAKEGVRSLNAAIFDVGISSYQIDNKDRGFGIKSDARLDMRMDSRLTITAYDIVNGYSQRELSEIVEKFGEERYHNRVARLIVEERARAPIETTAKLAEIVRKAVGTKYSKIDPATRTFQALRIAVNGELDALEEGLKKIVSWLDVGARVAVISFHSLEDRIVKNMFRGYSELGVLNIITKKPLRPSEEEVNLNPRSRSGRLRVAERM